MLKWSPEPFDAAESVTASAVVDSTEFEPAAAVVGAIGGEAEARQFRSEAGFVDPKSLMNSLTQEERSQVYELVEMDLADEYKAREQKLTSDFEARLAEVRAESESNFANWTRDIAHAVQQELKEASEAAARLAVEVAGKIVRREVAAEPQVLARAIETTIYKISESSPLTIQANPEDAAWLSDKAELLARLHIGEIVPDRRIERGGCLIQAGGREWDATLTRQMGSLSAIVDEMIATAETAASLTGESLRAQSPTEPEADDDPGVE